MRKVVQALRPGGYLLFCSSSLAFEETDGLVKQCMQDLQVPFQTAND